jgi:hypothetical protein
MTLSPHRTGSPLSTAVSLEKLFLSILGQKLDLIPFSSSLNLENDSCLGSNT